MSVQLSRADGRTIGTDGGFGVLPPNSRTLFAWLDEQPRFVTGTTTRTLKRSKNVGWTTGYVPNTQLLQAIERERPATMHVGADYEPTSKKCFSSQKDVAEAFADMEFPTHNIVERDGRKAAKLYTLSSYTDGVEGPSVGQFVGVGGRRQEEPGVQAHCEMCGWSSRVRERHKDVLKGGYRHTSLADHFEEDHPEVELTSTSSTMWNRPFQADLPKDRDLYSIEEGKRVTDSVTNFSAYQYADGSGEIEHYSTTEAIRTRSGHIISNSQCFSQGRAHCSTPSDTRWNLPLTGLQEVLDGDELSVYDIEEVLYDEESIYISGDYDSETGEWDYSDADVRRSGAASEATKVAVLRDGSGLAIVHDSTASNYHEQTVVFRLEPDMVDSLRRAEDVVETLLKPMEVSEYEAQHDQTVVPADEFQFSNGASGYYDAERLGDVVVRQGEWYFIPAPEGFEPDGAIYKNYHGSWVVPESKEFSTVDGVPGSCLRCENTSFEVDDVAAVCGDCGHAHVDTPLDRETVEWLNEEGLATGIPGDDALGNHRPREVAVHDGALYVRGSIRHLNSEHSMINLRDRWHKAVENTLDGVVLDTSTPDGSGRSGGAIARVE